MHASSTSGRCGEERWSPSRPRSRPNRSRAGWEGGSAAPPARVRSRRSWERSRPSPCRGPRAASGRSGTSGSRYSASRPANRRPRSRSCPGRRPASRAWRTSGPCGRWRRRPPSRRGGGTSRSRRDDPGRLLVGPVPVVPELAHRIENAPVHRLQTVPYVGQGPPHDDAHRIVEVGLPKLLLDVDVTDFLAKSAMVLMPGAAGSNSGSDGSRRVTGITRARSGLFYHSRPVSPRRKGSADQVPSQLRVFERIRAHRPRCGRRGCRDALRTRCRTPPRELASR